MERKRKRHNRKREKEKEKTEKERQRKQEHFFEKVKNNYFCEIDTFCHMISYSSFVIFFK